MDWQEIIAYAIGILAVVFLIKRFFGGSFKKKGKKSCGDCCS